MKKKTTTNHSATVNTVLLLEIQHVYIWVCITSYRLSIE